MKENVTNPRGLALDPRAKSRYIFWTDWGRFPRIERANMDGTNRQAIITTKIFWPNGLTLDLTRERIFFVDSHLDYIESCDYFGQKRTQILANDLLLHHPHGIAYFENNIFWVDRGHRQLVKINRFDTRNKTYITELSSAALNIKISHSLLQPMEDNPCATSNCEHLCLLSRNTSTGYRCDCQIGYTKDQNNENRCNVDQREFLIVLNKNVIGGLSIYSNDTIQTDDTQDPTPNSNEDADQSEISSEDSSFSSVVRDSGFLWDRLVPVNSIQDGFDFTYDFKEQNIFWLQHNQTSYSMNIHKVQFDGEKRELFASNDDESFGSPFCLEFDSYSRNLFIGNMMQSQIEIINVDNLQRTVLFSGNQNETGVGHPIRMTINYLDNELYWLDDGYQVVPKKIGAIKMDGTGARIIVQNDLNDPIAIVFHPNSKKIFFSDSGRKKIESISIDDSNSRSVIISDAEKPTALAIWDVGNNDGNGYDQEVISILYYVDQIQEQLVAFNLKTSEKRILKSNAPNIAQIKLYQQKQSLLSNSPCLNNNGGCHQLCLPSSRESSGKICRCSNGLQLQSQDGSCRPYQAFILFATERSIRATPFVDGNQINNNDDFIEALPILSGENIGKFDFDYKSKSIIWIEDERLVKILNLNFSWVSSPRYNRSTKFFSKKVLFELGSSTGELMSLAVDWINNLLYYSYTDSPFNYIKVTKFPSVEYHLTIFSSKSDKPSVIAVNPKLRYLYWIDEGQFSKLERAFLDGSNRVVLIKTEIVSPTDLFIDVKSGYVYWSDNTKDRIERCDWDGKNRMVIKSNNIPNTQSIFVLNDFLYYADARLKSVLLLNISLNNFTSSDKDAAKLIRKINSPSLKEVIVFSDKSQPINIDSPCAFNSIQNACDQLCFSFPNQSAPKCTCAIGDLDSNGRNCKVPTEYLIFAMENEIRSLNLPTTGPTETMPWKPITGLNKTIGIDFDFRDNKVIFSDLNEKKISSFIVGSENPVIEDLVKLNESLFRPNIGRPEGIAYDWISDTVFYTDNDLNQVVSYKVSTGMRLVLSYSESPRAIVVHPCKGYLFWTDVGVNPMIARTSLAGSNFEKIVSKDIKWVNGLSIDFDDERLYWADAYYDKIESSNLDGNYRKVLTTAYHPFAITVHGHYIYWTDWATKSM